MQELTFEEEYALNLLENAMRLKPKATALKNGAEKLSTFLNSDRTERPKLTEKNIEELDIVLAKKGINLAVLLKTRPKTTDAKPMPLVNSALEAYKQAFATATPVDGSSIEQPKATVSTTLNKEIEMIKNKLIVIRKKLNLDDAPSNKHEWIDNFSKDALDRIEKYGDRAKFSDKQIAVIDKYLGDQDNLTFTSTSTNTTTNYTLADIKGNKFRSLILNTDAFGKYDVSSDGIVEHHYSMLWNTQSNILNRLLNIDLSDAQATWIVDFLIKLENDSSHVARNHIEDVQRSRYFKCIDLLSKLVIGLETKQNMLSNEDRVYLQEYVKKAWSNEKLQDVINRAVMSQK
jgi:hypothetical protein